MKPEVCFNALHGRWGEDGCVQGLLELLSLPYTHSGVLASALAMHKERAKEVMRAAGVPVAEGRVVARAEAAKSHVLPRPYVLKPVTEGSSVGVFIVREDHTHPPQELNDPGWAYGESLLAERFIPGRELTCAVMGDRTLGVTEIVPAQSLGFYNYESKYAEGGSRHIAPGADFTECLRIGAEVNSNGSQGIGLPRRFACGLPLRRHAQADQAKCSAWRSIRSPA